MTKLCIVDLDGVVCDSTARFARAEQAKQEYLADVILQSWDTERIATDLYWRTALCPACVCLDTLITGVIEALDELANRGYGIVFLTSRPENMRAATVEWLQQHHVYNHSKGSYNKLIMKAPQFQYVKTSVWKAGMIRTIAGWHGTSDLVIVEDEQANIDEILKYTDIPWSRHIYKSLQEAMEALHHE